MVNLAVAYLFTSRAYTMMTGVNTVYIIDWETYDKYFAFQPAATVIGIAMLMLGNQMFMVAATQFYWQTYEADFV